MNQDDYERGIHQGFEYCRDAARGTPLAPILAELAIWHDKLSWEYVQAKQAKSLRRLFGLEPRGATN